MRFLFALLAIMILSVGSVEAADRYITVASTTSTQNSGLYDYLLPKFTEKTGIEVRVVAVGTGQAIRLARRGDADVLLVHHRPSEEEFVSAGFGVKRFDLMYNDFILVGPESDPANVKGKENIAAALKKIADNRAVFASRGDDSGTHKKELSLWKAAGVEPQSASGTWYRETGQGMGATLNVGAGMGAYILTDRASWVNFKNKGDLAVMVEGDERLFNQYGVILVNKAKHPHVKSELGQTFIDWLLSGEGQKAINAYTVKGRQLFTANAK